MDFWKTDKNRSDDFRASILVYGDTTGNCKAYGFKGKNVYNTLYQMRKRLEFIGNKVERRTLFMKKHDFESTSKKNAKEQTPEMAEREQEILMWMGDIRDDFILEAEDYKHYQSDKSVPGYFIVGGTLAAAAAICTAIFFQTGRNRIDHSNVPMQLPYQTEETKEIEWETEEETTEEETTQAETTEEETTQVETTQAETTEAALQKTTNEAGWLSHSTNYQLWCRQMKVQYLYIMHGMAALKLPFLENC